MIVNVLFLFSFGSMGLALLDWGVWIVLSSTLYSEGVGVSPTDLRSKSSYRVFWAPKLLAGCAFLSVVAVKISGRFNLTVQQFLDNAAILLLLLFVSLSGVEYFRAFRKYTSRTNQRIGSDKS